MHTLLDIFSTLATEHSPTLLASVLLLGTSAMFSSCETALFSLSAPDLNRIRASNHRFDKIILGLHNVLKSLLPTILFCNMAVNVLIYALAASVATDLGSRYGTGTAFIYNLITLFLVVFFGEVFPKQLAIASSLTLARLTAFPVWFIYRALGKPMRILNAIVTAFERVFDARRGDPRGVREEELRLLIELSRNDGAISEGEYTMIDGIVDLPSVRIKDVMIHRVDASILPAESSLAIALSEARRSGHCKMPVHSAAKDDLAGWVDVRDIFADRKTDAELAEETAESYLRGFHYFSEHDRCDQALERVKGGGSDIFAVVDERGVVVGFFTVQDIMDEVLGSFGEHGAPPPLEIREADGGYVISGRLSVREWRDVFDVSSAVPKSATVGGLIVSLLGRVPRVGDQVSLENMEMTVLSTWHNQVREVGLRLVSPESKEKADKKVSARMFR